MRRIAGRFEREPSGRVVFAIRNEKRATALDAWTPSETTDEVSVEVGMHSDPRSVSAAQETAAVLWSTCVSERAKPEPPDDEVTDVLELGNAPTDDPMEAPHGVGQA